MVPKGWSESYLGEVVTYKKGYAFNSSLYAEEGIRIVRISDTTRDSIHSDNPVFIAGGNVEGLEQYSLFENDIILSTVGSRPHLLDSMVGKAVKVPRSAHNSLLNQNLVKLIPKKTKITNEYLFSMLKTKEFIQFISNLVRGNANQVSITLADLFKYKFILPSLPEQKKIAQILSTWDKAISVTEKLLTNSQQQKKALMQQLLTGKKRLLDENGVRFSGEWEKGKFCDMANIDTGYAFKSKDFTQSDSGIPIIRMSDFKTGGLDVLGAAKVDRDSVNGLDKFKLRVGDFVFGMSGSLNNYGRVEKKDLPCYLNQRVGRILAKECANQAFITYLYLSDSIQQSILDKAAGAAQLNISISDLRSMVVYYPCIEEQQKIAAVLSAADTEISTLEKKLACLKDEKKALMQQLLTGKRRVKVDEAVAV
ncbi:MULTISPECIES: restriction endonuclease subunit S [Enterobacteriaceae]|uniref:restriction endonuclease subunit S n=1 Tax=Enterobacteriaceae TaxID=543 RepID=UPI000D1B0A68|nr:MULTISPECIES: restriction endonuclease subunit S [Enterobacteriaceae]MCZ0769749.1 restriction endonuclease subunit S [Salmonella enterica subsp. enterica serovar Rissen]HDK9887162.1 restriction endonuclease subunit S [Klebsiella pneumoniae]